MILCPHLSIQQGKISTEELGFLPKSEESILPIHSDSSKVLEYQILSVHQKEIRLSPLRKVSFPKKWTAHLLSINHPIRVPKKQIPPKLRPPLMIRSYDDKKEKHFLFYDPFHLSNLHFSFSSERWNTIEKELFSFRKSLNRELLNPKPNIESLHQKAKELIQWIFPKLKTDFFTPTIRFFSKNPPDLPLEWLKEVGLILFYVPGISSPRQGQKLALIQDLSLPYAQQEKQNLKTHYLHSFKSYSLENFLSLRPSLEDCNLLHISSHGDFHSQKSRLLYQGKPFAYPVEHFKLHILNACSTAAHPQSLILPLFKNGSESVIAAPSFLPENIASQFPIFYSFLNTDNLELSLEIFHFFYPEISRYYRYFKSIPAFI